MEAKPTSAFALPDEANFIRMEEEILRHWKSIDAFRTQLKLTEKNPPFTFYDGPPFATGTPHYGHISVGTIKDVITRYASMNGFHVTRRFGWDCHGLPIEFEIDKALKITDRRQVYQMGIDKYNEECRKIVMRHAGEWERVVERMGRWIDFRNDYKTMSCQFMESVWWVFKQIFDKGMVYQGSRVMPYSNRISTVLSNFEASSNYKDVSDPAIVVTFPLAADPAVSLLAWTTTPWTLPSNLALAVHPDMKYVKVRDLHHNRVFIMAKCRLTELYKSAADLVAEELKEDIKVQKKIDRQEQALKGKMAPAKPKPDEQPDKKDAPKDDKAKPKDQKKQAEKKPDADKQKDAQKKEEGKPEEGKKEEKEADAQAKEKPKEAKKEDKKHKHKEEDHKPEFEILETIEGKDLVGLEYTPLFDYYYEKMKPRGCFKVYAGNFVTNDTGTGIVHISPAYGEDDFNLAVKNKIVDPADPCVSVDDNGNYLPVVRDFADKFIFDCNPLIIEQLAKAGRVVKKGSIVHSYPMCWRSDTPLIYKAVRTWFIRVSEKRQLLVENNKKTQWVPKSMQKRFHEWVEKAEDWCFSRNRFWGNPIPLWVSEDREEVVCVGSIAELKRLAGLPESHEIADLHREFIDKIEIPSQRGKGKLRRIEEVFDCWFESGAMPYAHVGLPNHTSPEQFKSLFPADFIGEGADQIRGWFYTLNVLSALLFEESPYKNLIVNGMVLDRNGDKLSKSKKNYTDPLVLVSKVGADAVRLYFMNSPLVRAEELRFKDEELTALIQRTFIPWYNLCRLLNQEVARFNEKYGKSFAYEEELFDENKTGEFGDVIDRWILAQLEDLVKFVHEEFAGYRLYTVLHEKLRFLNELSNWYVKLCKARMKGDEGEEDAKVSLSVLLHCFLRIITLMAPFVPFITDYFYLNLRHFISPKSPLWAESIHFTAMPKAGKRFANKDLVESFEVFQKLVTSVRNARERQKVNVKQPLSAITIVPHSRKVRENLELLKEYFARETNILQVNITDESLHKNYVDFILSPDHAALGQKFKARYSKFKEFVMKPKPELTQEFMDNKKVKLTINFEGAEEQHELGEEFFSLKTALKAKPPNEQTVVEGEAEFAYELDFAIDEGLRARGLAREMTNRIQKLRKSLKLQISDRIYVVLYFPPESARLEKVFAERKEAIQAVIKKPLVGSAELPYKKVVGFEAFSLEGEYFIVEIVKSTYAWDAKKLEGLVDQKDVKEFSEKMQEALGPEEKFAAAGVHEINADFKGRSIKLVMGEHFKIYS